MVDDMILGEALEMDLGDVALVVEGGGGSIAVDRELSLTSKNPVQNKVITAALGEKQDALTPGQNVTIIDGTISADVDSEEIAASVTDWLDDNVEPVGSAVVVDSSLSIEGAAADAKATGDAIRTGGSGLTDEAKQALLACFQNVAWTTEDSQTYYDALEDALYPPANLVSISAVFNQGSAVIYDTDTLDTLKQYLTVTAYYDNSTTQTITNYTLSGTLTEGTSTITVLYGGKSTTFTVVVSHQANGLVDGTYSSSDGSNSYSVENNVVTCTRSDSYSDINIPFRSPINLQSGDVVTFSYIRDGGASNNLGVRIGFNGNTFSDGGSFCPYRSFSSTPFSKTVTLTEDMIATQLTLGNGLVDRYFGFVLLINGEDAFQ